MRGSALLLLVAAACARESSWEIRPDHVGPIRFGTPPGDTVSVPRTGCVYWRPAAAPPGVSIMIEDGIAVRADIDSGGVETAEGIGVGSTEAEIRDAYGQHVTVQLHKYQWEAGWRYFIYLPPGDSLHGAVFETDGHTVRTYRMGRRPQVQYVERCG